MNLDVQAQSWSAASGAEIEDTGREESLHDTLADPLAADADAVQMSKFEGAGPAASKTAREVSSNDVENPQHVVDRAENDKTGFR